MEIEVELANTKADLVSKKAENDDLKAKLKAAEDQNKVLSEEKNKLLEANSRMFMQIGTGKSEDSESQDDTEDPIALYNKNPSRYEKPERKK